MVNIPLPHMTTEPYDDGIGLNIWDGETWERHKFGSWDELEVFLWQRKS